MGPNLAVAAACAFILASGLLPGSRQAAPPSQPPTPEHWGQWQPQTDPADTRLDAAFVSISEPEITLADLLTRLSDQSSVQLTAADAFLASPLTVLADDCMLSGVMVSLAALCDGHWVFDRDQPPTQRAYHLIGSPATAQAIDRAFGDFFPRLTGTSLDERRARFPDRLALYRSALPLSPDEILSRYERDDPRLCATLLDPIPRATAEILCRLDPGAIHDLLYRGLTHVHLGDLSPAVGQQLRDAAQDHSWWSEGTADSYEWTPSPATEVPSDDTPVNLRWNGSDVDIYLGTPEHRTSPLATLPLHDDSPPDTLRRRLIELGYRADTPEYQSAIEAESRAWEAAQEEQAQRLGLLDLDEYFKSLTALLLGPPNETDPRLDIPLDLSWPDGEPLAAQSLLEQAARQCLIAVIADQPHLEGYTCSPNQLSDPPTLRSILNGMRDARGGGISWSFHGRYLVVVQDDCVGDRLLYPEEPLQWLKERNPVALNAMEDIFAVMALAYAP